MNSSTGNFVEEPGKLSPRIDEKTGPGVWIVSTHELFYPDCLLLKGKVEKTEGTNLELSIKYKMVHDWVVMPIPESAKTIDEIAQFYIGTPI